MNSLYHITMLGTGNALATRCYNTCFTLHDPSGEILLVDAGGDNGVLTQLERAQIDLRAVHDLFITHTHTDHLLGAVWVMRMALQFGFVATIPNGKRLCCLGDEPYNPLCRSYAEGADVLMCEAFCLYADHERFQPYEKHHSSALDAARTAESLHARTLILYHTEDSTLATRRERYTAEAKSVFSGTVIVPDDLERIVL